MNAPAQKASCAGCGGCKRRAALVALTAPPIQAKVCSGGSALDLISAIGCLAFVVLVLVSTFLPLLARADETAAMRAADIPSGIAHPKQN